MDSKLAELETKCENMMSVVVESRKRFGRMCVEYEQKASLMENKILDLKTEAWSNYRFKPKHPIQDSVDDYSEIDDFKVNYVQLMKRFDSVRRRVKNTQDVVLQLKQDDVGKRLREPLKADVMLAKAKQKMNS